MTSTPDAVTAPLRSMQHTDTHKITQVFRFNSTHAEVGVCVCVRVCERSSVWLIFRPSAGRQRYQNQTKSKSTLCGTHWLCKDVQMRAASDAQTTSLQSKGQQKLSVLHLFAEQTLMSMLHYWFAQMIPVMLWWVVFGAFQSYFRLFFFLHSTFMLVFAVLT